MVTFQTKLSEISRDPFLRFDFDYLKIKKDLFDKNIIFLKDFIDQLETGHPITREDYVEYGQKTDYIHLVVRNIKNGEMVLDDPIYLNADIGEDYKKYRIKKGDIILAISSNCGASFLYDGSTPANLTLSHYLVKLRVSEQINKKLLVYYLNSKKLKQYFRSIETGKSQKNLSKYYLRYLPVASAMANKNIQQKIIIEIDKIEKEIKQLKLKFRKPQEIIDEVFAEEFDYDPKILARAKQEKIIAANFSDYGKREDLRFGFRFHNAAGRTALKILQGFTQKRIRDFLSEPIKLGAGISPQFYDDENGEAYYLTMATIKNWQFYTEEAKKVLKEYWESEQKKNSVRKNDVIIARSGEGTIGKVAIIENEEHDAIFCDFTMRVRFANYDPYFAYYYFRTAPFQTLIESNKKGLGNNTNIFPSQIRDFPLPDISLARQDQIVLKIRTQLEAQEAKRAGIEQKRAEIEKIIETKID